MKLSYKYSIIWWRDDTNLMTIFTYKNKLNGKLIALYSISIKQNNIIINKILSINKI